MSEVCLIHGCELEDFISSTEEGTEYFTVCPKCEEGFNEWLLSQDTHETRSQEKPQ